jgi:hypothetical protein
MSFLLTNGKTFYPLKVFVIVSLVFTSCAVLKFGGLKAIIIDNSSLQTPVENVTLLQGKNSFYLLEGEAERTIPLKRVNWVKISPKEMQSKNGKTYFLSEMELKDGTKVMSYRLKDGRKSQAFICVDDTVVAKTQNGTLRLDLSKVSKITFE